MASVPGAQGSLANALDGGAQAGSIGADLGNFGAGAIIGAARGAVTGGGTGALIGGVQGGVSAGVGSALGPGGAGLGGAFSSGIGSIAGQIAGNTLTGAMAPNGSTGMYPTSTAMPVGSSLTSFFNNPSNIAGLAGVGSAVAGGVSNSNIASMQTNAYTTAGNAANYGNNWGATGAGGVGANFSNGQYNTTAGAFSPMTTGYANTGASSIGAAGQYAGGTAPSNVTSGYNTYMNTLNNGIGTANTGVTSGQGIMNMGTNTLNSANANYNSAYNTSLNAGLAALNPAIQQQSNALLNSNFERGQAGTSGGALNTQALQNSFNTADEQVQQNAVTQGLAAMNTTGSLGLGEYNAGTSATGNFNTQAGNFGQQALTGNQSYSSYAPTLAGQYINNANATGQGATTVNNMGILTGQAAQGAVTNQGTQMNNAAKTQGAIANTYNGGLSSYLSSMLGGVSGNLLSGTASGATGGISSLIQSLFGGSGTNSSQFNSPYAQSFDTTSGGVNSNGVPTDLAPPTDTSLNNYQYQPPSYGGDGT